MSDSRAEADREPPVERILDRLQAGVRQRVAEHSTADPSGDAVSLGLSELQRAEFVEEPPCVSPRPVIGRLLVLARKAMHKLFVRWYARPVLQQQNRFNSVAATMIRELVEENRELRRRLELLQSSLRESPPE